VHADIGAGYRLTREYKLKLKPQQDHQFFAWGERGYVDGTTYLYRHPYVVQDS
jgi:hypothetical protein